MWNSEMRIKVKGNDEDTLYGNWKIHVKVIGKKEHAWTKVILGKFPIFHCFLY